MSCACISSGAFMYAFFEALASARRLFSFSFFSYFLYFIRRAVEGGPGSAPVMKICITCITCITWIVYRELDFSLCYVMDIYHMRCKIQKHVGYIKYRCMDVFARIADVRRLEETRRSSQHTFSRDIYRSLSPTKTYEYENTPIHQKRTYRSGKIWKATWMTKDATQMSLENDVHFNILIWFLWSLPVNWRRHTHTAMSIWHVHICAMVRACARNASCMYFSRQADRMSRFLVSSPSSIFVGFFMMCKIAPVFTGLFLVINVTFLWACVASFFTQVSSHIWSFFGLWNFPSYT